MAMMTSVAPMTIPQINRYYYVGQEPFDTIQETVTFAVSDGNLGAVIIPEGYTGSDSITAVTGGTVTVIIIDERGGQRQAYFWFNNVYTYQSIHSRGGVLTPQLNNYAFVGFGVHATIQEVIDNFATLPALTITIIVEPSYTGNEVIGELVNGDAGIIIADLRTAQWQNYTWNGTNFVPADFIPEGTIIANSITADSITSGTIDAEDATFETCIVNESPVRTFANTADGPSQGMIWPEIGIPVSLGDHWQDPSINPASLAGWPPVGVPVSTGTAWTSSIAPASLAVWPPVGVPVSTGTAWTFSIDPATIPRTNTANTFTGLNTIGALTVTGAFTALMNNNASPPVISPTAGGFALGWNAQIFGETDFINSHGGGGGGFNWYNVGGGVSIGPATPKAMYLASNNALYVNGDTVSYSVHATGTSQLAAIPNSIWMDFIGGTGARIVTIGPSAGVLNLLQFAAIDSAGGSFAEYGRLSSSGFTTSGYLSGGTATSIPQANARQNGFYLFNISTLPLVTMLECCGDSGSRGQLLLVGTAPGGAVASHNYAVFGVESGTSSPGSTIFDNLSVTTQTPGAAVNLVIGEDPSTSANWGGASMSFTPNVGTGNYGQCAINASKSGIGFSDILIGNGGSNITLGGPSNTVHVNGTFTATTKNFKIPHPLAPQDKYLIHSCLEGPEITVYYRGETVTAKGQAEVTLPDYFEALTSPTDRSVLLTQIFEDDSEAIIGSNTFSMLMASRVKDGKFKIRSSEPVAKVWWEVKAVRRDVEPLVKETRKDDYAQPHPSPDNAGVVGDRTPEAGESQPQKVRAGDAVAAGSNRARKSHKGA